MERFTVKTNARAEMIPVTDNVRAAVAKCGVKSGIVVVYCPHTTAGLTVNENADPDVARDMTAFFSKLVPQRGDFRHAEGNSDAHIKTSIFGPSLSLIVEDGDVQLGTWQGIYLCESDGPRTREVWVQSVGA
jgi:secondary thiamine-phosphate synthase enzyme